ncbi:hypothetical protein [Winogradskyella sp.]
MNSTGQSLLEAIILSNSGYVSYRGSSGGFGSGFGGEGFGGGGASGSW